MSAPDAELVLDMRSVFAGRTIRGIIGGDSIPRLCIPRMITLHREGRLPFDKLVRFYKFDEIDRAIADAEDGTVVKPVLRFSGS